MTLLLGLIGLKLVVLLLLQLLIGMGMGMGRILLILWTVLLLLLLLMVELLLLLRGVVTIPATIKILFIRLLLWGGSELRLIFLLTDILLRLLLLLLLLLRLRLLLLLLVLLLLLLLRLRGRIMLLGVVRQSLLLLLLLLLLRSNRRNMCFGFNLHISIVLLLFNTRPRRLSHRLRALLHLPLTLILPMLSHEVALLNLFISRHVLSGIIDVTAIRDDDEVAPPRRLLFAPGDLIVLLRPVE